MTRGPAEVPPAESASRPQLELEGRSFTGRAVLAGLAVGLIICFSNMYFGLQTGWVSTMTLPSSLMGFGIFKALSAHLSFPFTPVENVLVQTVAGSMAIMPLGCGFVGVIPAMNYLLSPAEHGPIAFQSWELILWSLGLCYFGVVFAVPLRRQVIIRERLRFPSGFSTAVLIGVLHGRSQHQEGDVAGLSTSGGYASLVPKHTSSSQPGAQSDEDNEPSDASMPEQWASHMRLLLGCFAVSGLATFITFFFPVLRNIPLFGQAAATYWLWAFNPSLAYVGQGIIMGPETTLHMTLGAVIAWGFLSPLAYYKGWAPGSIDDWETGSKGWVVWVSLSIMLVDSIINLGYITLRSLAGVEASRLLSVPTRGSLSDRLRAFRYTLTRQGYSIIEDGGEYNADASASPLAPPGPPPYHSEGNVTLSGRDSIDYHPQVAIHVAEEDAPPEHQVGPSVVWVGLAASILLCVLTTHAIFGNFVPLHATVLAVAMALLLSIMGVRALGETDLNPVSGISKLAQLFFALIFPASSPASVLTNLVAGAVSEAGALQAGELMQDLKTGHLLGAAPNAQFWGQVIGATVGAIASGFIYRLYTTVYRIPGDPFQVPTAYVWIFTARLVTGRGLPPMAKEWALASGILFALATLARLAYKGRRWRSLIPGGIAVAVGMYNVPSFTLARMVGGLLSWYWLSVSGRPSTTIIIVASGFILGEGVFSIVNLFLESLARPHT